MKKIILTLCFIVYMVNVFGQVKYYYPSDQMDTIENYKFWYSATEIQSIEKVVPKLVYIEVEEFDFKGNVLTCTPNANSSKVIIASNRMLPLKKSNISFESVDLTIDKEVELDNGIYMVVERIPSEENFSLFIVDKIQKKKREIFRNCSKINEDYFLCGSFPFAITFVGDLNNDDCPEYIIDAGKEIGTLRLLIGHSDGEYKLLKQGVF